MECREIFVYCVRRLRRGQWTTSEAETDVHTSFCIGVNEPSLCPLWFFPDLTQSRWRLSNGTSPAQGRLQYRSEDDDWVCLCPYADFSNKYYTQICQELGFKQMLSYYKFSSASLFGGCREQIYYLFIDGELVSAIPRDSRDSLNQCDPSQTIGLHCVNSK